MQEISDNENEVFVGGKYARTEEDLYKKAIALLEKCEIATLRLGQEIPEFAARGGEEGVDDFSLADEIGVRRGGGATNETKELKC